MALVSRVAGQAAQRIRREERVERLGHHLRTPLYRNAYALILSNIVTSALGIVYWMLGARLYSTEAVGLNSALLSTMVFLSGVSQLNLRSALNRFVPVAGHQSSRLVGLAYLVTLPVTVVVGVAFFAGIGMWAAGSPLAAISADVALVAFFIVATATWSIFNMQDGVLTGIRRAMIVPVENTIYAVVKIGLLVMFAVPLAQYGIFASWSIPVVVAVILMTALIFRRLLPRHVVLTTGQARPLAARQIIKFVAGDYAAALLVLLYTSLLPVLVISQAGATAGAYFYIVWIIATSLNLLPLSMAISHTVESVAGEEDLLVQTRRVLMHMARLLVPLVLLVILASPYLLSLFGPGYAEEGTDLLRLLAIGVLPYAVNVLYFSYARVTTRVRGIVITQAVLAAMTIGLSLVLLGSHGIVGVGMAWLISQTTIAVALLTTALRPILRSRVA